MAIGDQEKLVLGLRQGDPEAQGLLLDRYGQPLIRFLVATCHLTLAEAEDIAVETLYKAILHVDSFILKPGSGPNALRNWLFTIARNHWRDMHRREINTISLLEDDQALLSNDVQFDVADAEPSSLILEVREALAELPAPQRKTLVLHYGGLDLSQVAIVLGVQPGTVRQWKRRGLMSLKGKLERKPAIAPLLSRGTELGETLK